MKLMPCDEKNATHVQVLDEMIKTDDGLFAESIPVRWLREVPS